MDMRAEVLVMIGTLVLVVTVGLMARARNRKS